MRHIYYGWRAVVPISVIATTLLVGIYYVSFGVFVIPVSQDLGLTRAETNTALILVNVGTALSAPLMGRLLDTLPIKPIMVFSALLLAASTAAVGLSHSLWLSALILLIPLSAATQGAGLLSMNVLIVRWFKVMRGRAMTLGMLGMSFGAILIPPAISFMIDAGGWRFALMMCGAAVALILTPLFVLVRPEPHADEVESRNPAPVAAATENQGGASDRRLTVGEILKRPAFWTIMLSSGAAVAVSTSTLISLVPLGVGIGLTTLEAAALISVNGLGALAGKILVATFGDRFRRIYLLAAIFLFMGACEGALLLSGSYTALLVTAVCFGLCGPLTPVFYTLVADRFGQASFGTALGMMFPVNAIIAAVAVRFAGEVFDRTGGYDFMLGTYVVVQLAATLLLLSTQFIDRPEAASRTAAD